MRPITLTMKAFGSFAQEGTVSFETFRNGLFLIVGETGAGKTTIFDAIVFALFGKASGKNREPDMMHSDYVDKSQDTEVAFTFDQAGRRYTAFRTIHFPKRRGREDDYGDGVLSAELRSPDAPPVTGHAAVTRRCEELLGLNADQFRKIVMLAQGEFREFLSADSARKSEILGKLFDSSQYVRYQALLGGARAALEAKRRQLRETVDTLMSATFLSPEDGGDGFLYSAEHPRLVENLDGLIGRERETEAGLRREKEAAQKAVDEINVRKGAAESDNQKLDELAAQRARAVRLEARRGEMERLSRACVLAEKALHKVCPIRDRWLAARDAADRARADIAGLSARKEDLRKALERAEATAQADGAARDRLAEIDVLRRRTEESLPTYDALAEKLSERERVTKEAANLGSGLNAAVQQRGRDQEALKAGLAELASLESADAEAVRTEAQRAQAGRNAEAWNGVVKGIAAARADARALAQGVKRLRELTAEAQEAENGYHQAYQAFISGQAGIMAERLESELKTSGRAQCPVCRAVFHAGQAHEFARCVEGTPTQAAVEAAKRRSEACEKERAAQDKAAARQKADLDRRREALLSEAQKLAPACADWETLDDDAYLEEAAGRFHQAEEAAETAHADACRKQKRKGELAQIRDRLSAKIEKLAGEIAEKEAALRDAELRVTALTTQEEGLRSTLPFETRARAEENLAALQKERGEIGMALENHRQALNAAKEALDKAEGELSGKMNALPEQEKAAADGRRAFDAALAANGFSDADALAEALAPLGGADGEDWLARQREQLTAFWNDCQNAADRIKTLAAQTANLRYTDIDALQGQRDEAAARRDAAEKACADQQKRRENHEDVRKRVSAAMERLAKTDAAWARLDRLSALAVGANAEGGRLSFERYVMGSIFREVLDMANQRLDIMSGGRYALAHSLNAGRANAVSGLEIEVLDVATGRQRSADSLSGGESFQVSLSLALGLSDVVQGHAGGMGLDTLFIDEGFGALDDGALDNAITVLNQLTEGNRLVGIISHVDKLEESIPQKLRVKKTSHGSELACEV